MPDPPPDRATPSATGVGAERPRGDSRDKVLGAVRYADDLPFPGLLQARLVQSVYAHARIRSIDARAALAVPGVVAVLTARDLPTRDRDAQRLSEPLATSEAVFAGQPLALVVAETAEAAADGAELVVVDADPLEPVVDPAMAMGRSSVLARELPGGDAPEEGRAAEAEGDGPHEDAASGNVSGRTRHQVGDPEAAFEACEAVVEGHFETSWIYQGYLEPHSATAWVDPDGTLVVAAATQGTFFTRRELARLYGLSPAAVRVIGTPLGGSFGSKFLVLEPLVAGAALRLRRPVRLTLTRREDFSATNPAPGTTVDLRLGARDGKLAALTARVLLDAGAFDENAVDSLCAYLIAGPYHWPTFDIEALGVRTNRFGTGQYRGPGGPQMAFALESLVDELAERLGLDPVAFRLASLAEPGQPTVNGRIWQAHGMRACLAEVARSPLWARRGSLPPGEGIGLAIGYWGGATGPATAVCRLDPDGSLTVVTGIVDMSGVSTALALIAAETFGVGADHVRTVSLDTAGAPQSPDAGGSVATYAVGEAVRQAAAQARDQLLRYAAERLEIDPADLEIVAGIVRPIDAPDRGLSVASLAAALHDFGSGFPYVEGHASAVQTSRAPSAAAHLSHLRVDPQSGQVTLLEHLAIQDAGRAIDPALVRGQMVGATVQGIGWALWEALRHDPQGQLLSGTFLDYALPAAAGLPSIEARIVEVPAPDGPFGARGVGEAPIVPVPAAVANAIRHATGFAPRVLPITAARIWAAANGASSGRQGGA